MKLQEGLNEQIESPLSLNATNLLKLLFYHAFLIVGVTEPWFLQAKLLTTSVNVRANGSRPLYQHRKNPYS